MSFPSLIQNKGITSTFTARLGNMTAKGILTLKHTQLQTQLRKVYSSSNKITSGATTIVSIFKNKEQRKANTRINTTSNYHWVLFMHFTSYLYPGWILGGYKNPTNAMCVKPAIAEMTVWRFEKSQKRHLQKKGRNL